MEAIEVIQKFPKFLLKRFPYLVLYIPEEDKILITAIAHQHRKPDYYINRIK